MLLILSVLLPLPLLIGAFVAILFLAALAVAYPILWLISANPRGCC
jgi:hypothetical protein